MIGCLLFAGPEKKKGISSWSQSSVGTTTTGHLRSSLIFISPYVMEQKKNPTEIKVVIKKNTTYILEQGQYCTSSSSMAPSGTGRIK